MSGTYRRDPFGDGKVWAVLLGGALALVAVLYLLSCGGSRGPAREAARLTRFVVEANCSDMMPVVECLEQIDRNAAAADSLFDGGLR